MTVRIRDYMVLEVEHFRTTTPIHEAIERLTKSRHHGLPVTDETGKLVGFVSAKELLRHASEGSTPLSRIIRPGTYTAHPETALDDAARIMFRFGLRDLPIIDDNGRLCGVLSNLDVVRSHFERASPTKADTLKQLLTERYHLPFSIHRGLVPIHQLTPTQWKVFEDELEGRRYELERGFAEPVLVLQKGESWILVDWASSGAGGPRDGAHPTPGVRAHVRPPGGVRPAGDRVRARGPGPPPPFGDRHRDRQQLAPPPPRGDGGAPASGRGTGEGTLPAVSPLPP